MLQTTCFVDNLEKWIFGLKYLHKMMLKCESMFFVVGVEVVKPGRVSDKVIWGISFCPSGTESSQNTILKENSVDF